MFPGIAVYIRGRLCNTLKKSFILIQWMMLISLSTVFLSNSGFILCIKPDSFRIDFVRGGRRWVGLAQMANQLF